MPLASVWRAAKPITSPSTADEARMPVATPCASGNLAAATPTPIRTITTNTSLRISRRRVWFAGESSPRVTTSPTRVPRLAMMRSTICATTNAITTTTPA